MATQAIEDLVTVIEDVAQAETVESMLGYEGHGANLYFQGFASLLKGSFSFEKRTRRPPTDPVNSLLSLGYTLLSQNVHAMVEGVGLHTHFGNLHMPQGNRPSLVCDLMEEFRALVVDSLVSYLIPLPRKGTETPLEVGPLEVGPLVLIPLPRKGTETAATTARFAQETSSDSSTPQGDGNQISLLVGLVAQGF